MKALRRLRLIPLFVGLFIISSGCSGVKKVAIKGVSPVLDDVNEAIFYENDLELVKNGLPSTIILVEGMVRASPKNYKMLVLAAKAFAGYAIVMEDEDPEHASMLYLKGKEYGLRALKRHRGFRNALENETPFEEAVKLINRKKYLPALIWTGLCWGLDIMLRIDDPMAVINATKVRAIMEQASAIDDSYFYGMAHVFFGSYYAILPSIFGGGPEVVQAEFDKAFKASEKKFLLAKVFYARYYATLIMDEELFERELNEVLETPSDILPEMVFLNEIESKGKANDRG